MKKLLLLCSFILLMGGSLPALAACTTAPVSAAFGGVSSFTVNTTASTVSAPGTLNCGTGVLTLLSSDSVTVQLVSATSSTGNRGTLRLSDTIPVQLCTDSACATELGIGGTLVTYSRSQLLGLSIGTGNQVVFSLPFFLRTVPGAVVAAGTYTVTLNVQVVYNVCTGVGIGGLCLLGSQNSGTTTLPLTATIAIANDCTTITSPAVNFGSAPLVSSFTGVSQSINVICTKGSTYSVGMNNGIHAVGAQRYMASGTNLLAYEIYKGSGTASRWGGTVTAERMQSTAANSVSTDGLTRTFNYNAQVLTSQATPVAGSYSDTITVDLSF